MKKYLFAALGLLFALQGVAAPAEPVVIWGDKAFPPYEFINENGEPDGFNVDLVRAVMNELHFPYELRLEDWTQVLRAYENSEVDLIAGMAKSPERELRYHLGSAHSFVDYNLVCRKDAPLRGAADLFGKSIILQRNSLPYEILTGLNYDGFILVDNMIEGLKQLSEGHGDVAVCPDNMAQDVIYKEGLTNLQIVDSGWPLREYGFAAADPALLAQVEAALLTLRKNGIYDQIRTKWMGDKQPFRMPGWVYVVLATLVLTALLLYFFVYIYKRRARRSELLLKEENEKLNASLAENKNLLTRYLTVFNTTLVGLSYYDKDGIMMHINDQMMRMFGQPDRESLIRERISIYRNPIFRDHGIVDDKDRIHEFHGVLKYDMRKGHCPDYFARFEPKNDICYFKMDITPIMNRDGRLDGVLVTAIDHTAEIDHERQLAEEETKLTLALEAGNIAAWIYDLRSRMFMSLRGNALAGEGLSLEENQRILHPDDRAMQNELLDALSRGEKEFGEATFRYLQEDGSYHYYDSRMIVRREDDCVTAILGTQKDITREVQSNKILNSTVDKLRFAIHTAGMAMWEYDCQSAMFISYNDPIADYKDGALVTMEAYENYFQKEGTNWEALGRAKEIMKGGIDEPYSFEVKLKTRYDTDSQYCTMRGLPMEKDANGRVVKYLGVRVNITEQIKYQKVLEREKDQAQQADKLKSAFLANMSHEIRTPLNAIVGFSELLFTTEDREECAQYMNIIRQNNDLLLRLIGDILDLSKIESGLIELKPESFDMAEVLRETFAVFRQRCLNPEVQLLARNPYRSCKLRLDRNRVVQVGTNFLTNALKHTRKGHILMGYEYVDKGLKIYVEDTGCGIPKENQSLLFRRFAKLDDFTQGTGLGLAISKAITDAQGGRIGVVSEQGKGSTFWAWFPCDAEIEEQDNPVTTQELKCDLEPAAREVAQLSGGDKKSILIAEDIDSNYLLVKAILKTFTLTRAKTGREAVDLAREHRYDAILMDMKMPVMDGLEATRLIREFDTQTPIVAVTANAFDSDREEALAAGCNAFVTKPIKKSDLEALLG